MKRIYESPELQQIDLLSESLLITASPGVGGDFDPTEPIGAPRQGSLMRKKAMKNPIKKDQNEISGDIPIRKEYLH